MSEFYREIEDLISAAQSGRDAPLLSGPHMLFWGSITVIALIVTWANLSNIIGAGDMWWTGSVWIAAFLVAIPGSIILGRKRDQRLAVNSLANIAAKKSFIAGGIVVWAFAFAVSVRNGILVPLSEMETEPLLYDLIITVAFLAFSVVFGILGALTKRKWFYGQAGITGTGAISTLLFLGTVDIYLVAALGFFLVMIVPGLVLTLHQPSMLEASDLDG